LKILLHLSSQVKSSKSVTVPAFVHADVAGFGKSVVLHFNSLLSLKETANSPANSTGSLLRH
jgi:hypothetical protein